MRIALGIEYDGTDYMGWQRLSHGPSVQQAVEEAIAAVANHDVRVFCAGRTDSGVDALCQVAHFESDADRDMRQWVLGANSSLAGDVSILWAQQVADDFHARFSAIGRSYRYTIANRQVRPAVSRSQLCWFRKPLDVEKMHQAAQALLGEHDFSAFRASACQANTATRRIESIGVSRQADRVILDIRATAFLHHMVRNIVGSLLPIGSGEQPVEWMGELLASKDRTLAAATASAAGLAFVSPHYSAAYGLPVPD